MKFAIEGDHKFFFENEHWVEFEGLLSTAQCQTAKEAVIRALRKRLPSDQDDVSQLSSPRLYMEGRDLWREELDLKRIVCRQALAEVAAQLLDKTPLRLAYTQLLGAPQERTLHGALGAWKIPALEGAQSLVDLGPVQEPVGGLLLCLEAPGEPLPQPYPNQPGSGAYLSISGEYDFSPILLARGGLYLLIVFAGKSAVYVERVQDPLTHCFKSQGYGYGDKLRDDTHPILRR